MVVDDEAPARQRLLDLLAKERDVEIAGAFANPADAVAALRRGACDLVFLDIQMPGLTGIDVIREVGAERMPMVVFVTAFDQHAIEAFQLHAVDYLLKPYDDTRFKEALDRARQRRLGNQLAGVLEALQPSAFLQRVAVKDGERTIIVPVDRIDYIEADGPYAEIHAGTSKHLLRERMHVLEGQLDPKEFVRIHRSTIVRLDRIASLEPYFNGELVVRLRDGTSLRVSRGQRAELEKKLGL